jgi:cell division protein FtsI/penicillin-binding protein 2
MRNVNIKNRKTSGKLSVKHWRINTLVFFISVFAFVIIARLYDLQVINYKTYNALAQSQHRIEQTLEPTRGEIFLEDESDPYPVAVNQELQLLYAVPTEITDPDGTASKIAQITGLDENDLKNKLSQAGSEYQVLQHKLSDDEVNAVKSLNLKGIYMEPEDFRFYPSDELASQVVGFVGSDGNNTVGRYGIEASFEDELKGQSGSLTQDRDSQGRWISIGERNLQPAVNGDNLVLTLNHTVQFEVENILKDAVEQHQADNGSAIVMDPKTGKILAMANYPDFDPNNYSQVDDMSDYINSTISSEYECGSIFKTVTMAIGLDSGKITPDTTYVDTGAVHEAGYTIQNADLKAHGTQTMTQVLDMSYNTGAIYAEKLIGNQTYLDYLHRFGFGQKTGIDLPAEATGNISNLEQHVNRNIEFDTASFGQGITSTPIQIADFYSAMANGGILMKPQIIDKIIHPDGRVEEVQPEEVRQVVSPDTAQKISTMLESVVTNGEGKKAAVPGYRVGGKTGTAQVPKPGGGYEDGVTIGSFAGYAPLDDPQFVVLVKIYHPKDVQWAESSAAPTWGKIMQFLLEYYNVEPTEPIDINKLPTDLAPATSPAPANIPPSTSTSNKNT